MTRPSSTSAKVFFAGTHRVRLPQETWELLVPKLIRYGITRIADITGLDTIGIPVVMSVRPLAKTLSVSQGKGQSLLLAKISAAMEAIELWHAEHVALPVIYQQTPADRLPLPYRVAAVAETTGALVNESTPLDWVHGTGLATDRAIPVPQRLVTFQGPDEQQPWVPAGFIWNSNGLASGNSVEEATLHALYELVERDALAALPADQFGVELDIDQLPDEATVQLVEMVRRAGAFLSVHHVPSRVGIPCFAARIWSADFPVASVGFGAHLAPDVALSRAITEAAQSRLTVIAGSRDDIPPLYHRVQYGIDTQPVSLGPSLAWSDCARPAVPSFADVIEEVAWIASNITGVVGHEPVVVNLSCDDGDPAVVKVIVPGMTMGLTHYRHV